MSPSAQRAVVDAYLEARRAGDPSALRTLRAEAFTAEWPQSGERVRNAADMAAIEAHQPGGHPRLTHVRRVVGEGDLWLIEGGETYAASEAPWHTLDVLRLADGRIAHVTSLFGEPFPVPGWRAPYTVAIDRWASPAAARWDRDEDERDRLALVERYRQASRTWDLADLRALRHRDWYQDWPQSGERVPDIDTADRLYAAWPGLPSVSRVRVVQDRRETWTLSPLMAPMRVMSVGGLCLMLMDLDYPAEGHWLGATIAEVRDGLLGRQVDYFMQPFEPPAWREPYVERTGVLVDPEAPGAERPGAPQG